MFAQLRAVLNRAGVGKLMQHNVTCANLQQVRHAVSAFNTHNSDFLWKSITVVSKNGTRRGRGKRVNSRLIKDLYKGQVLGDGKVKMVWPGLNVAILKGRQVVQQERIGTQDPNVLVKEEKDLRPKRLKVHPLDRGFTSLNICGRNLKNSGFDFPEDFDFRVIDSRNVCHMTGMFGRYQTSAIVVACGNGNGVLGLGYGKALAKKNAIQKAANRAYARLLFVDRYENRTVLHDFFSQYYATKIFVTRKPEGYGLKCHRVIILLCKLLGIKDLHAKVEGSVMPMNIAKAFLLGLVRQKKYEEFAEEKKLHVVEFDPRCRYFPNVLASPSVCRTEEEIPTSESLDFTQMALGGRVKYERPVKQPWYVRTRGWQTYLKKWEKKRGMKESECLLRARHANKSNPGDVRSFLTDKYPEAHRVLWTN